MQRLSILLFCFISGCATKAAPGSKLSSGNNEFLILSEVSPIIIAAIIGGIATLIAAKISKRNQPYREISIEVLNDGNISGDIVGIKNIQYLKTNEIKSRFSYWFERIYSFVFLSIVSGLIFVPLGGEYIGNIGVGLGVGISLAFGYSMQDRVSKYKGII